MKKKKRKWMLGFLAVPIVKVPNSSGASQVTPVVKNLPADAGDIGDPGSTPGWGRLPGGGHGDPLQDSCLENPMVRGAWKVIVHGVAKSYAL